MLVYNEIYSEKKTTDIHLAPEYRSITFRRSPSALSSGGTHSVFKNQNIGKYRLENTTMAINIKLYNINRNYFFFKHAQLTYTQK